MMTTWPISHQAPYPCPACGAIIADVPLQDVRVGIGWLARIEDCPSCHHTVQAPRVWLPFGVPKKPAESANA